LFLGVGQSTKLIDNQDFPLHASVEKLAHLAPVQQFYCGGILGARLGHRGSGLEDLHRRKGGFPPDCHSGLIIISNGCSLTQCGDRRQTEPQPQGQPDRKAALISRGQARAIAVHAVNIPPIDGRMNPSRRRHRSQRPVVHSAMILGQARTPPDPARPPFHGHRDGHTAASC